MKLTSAADHYIADLQRMGRITSPHTENSYRHRLTLLAEDTGNRDPSKVGREDIKRYLGRWHGNTQLQAHAIAASFFDWCQEESLCKHNPARMVRRARPTKPDIYRMTRDEVVTVLDAANAPGRRRDRWVAHLGCCAGLRSQELRGLQGRHFARPGFVWVSREIAKGRKERWVPVLTDLEPVVEEVLTLIGIDEYVIPGRRIVDPPWNTKIVEDPTRPLHASSLYKQVVALGERAGIAGRLTPHVLRHAYGDHIAKYAGLRVAQALLGHADVGTTASTYVDVVGLDELAAQVRGFSFWPATPVTAPDAAIDTNSGPDTA